MMLGFTGSKTVYGVIFSSLLKSALSIFAMQQVITTFLLCKSLATFNLSVCSQTGKFSAAALLARGISS